MLLVGSCRSAHFMHNPDLYVPPIDRIPAYMHVAFIGICLQAYSIYPIYMVCMPVQVNLNPECSWLAVLSILNFPNM